jgi:hypothetical protein
LFEAPSSVGPAVLVSPGVSDNFGTIAGTFSVLFPSMYFVEQLMVVFQSSKSCTLVKLISHVFLITI